MKRRDFLSKGSLGAIAAAAVVPLGMNAAPDHKEVKADDLGDRKKDNWTDLGTAKKRIPQRKITKNFDVCVIGGGAAGICAAVAAARNGAKVGFVQDRQVLGGNASSEIRVHLNGVNHLKDGLPERETGIIEELLLHNRFENPQESYPVFDHVMYDFVVREPNIDLMLGTQAVEAKMSGSKIKAARCWQGITETEIMIHAPIFIDCSGDGLLAATAGAEYRTGREASSEFGEKYAPKVADGWQMGASILMSSIDMGKPMPYTPPSYAIKYEAEKAHPKRYIKGFEEGIWWIEVGSEHDIIGEHEIIRHKLMGYLHGVWDYIKNSGKHPEATNFALDWVGTLAGRRESRRFIGDYILSETDMTQHKHFEDAIGFGGWSLDEHNPGGIENLSEPPSYFHEHFSEIYEVPFRSLYSKNISNLMFAGRNVSQTHIALSSSRIMATCALMGQAAGTAGAICAKKGVKPRDIYQKYIKDLQENLLRDDVFIPKRFANDSLDLAKKASVIFASSTLSGDAKFLTDGVSRDLKDEPHHWQSNGLNAELQLEWENPIEISKVEIKCDTNVKRNIMMRKDKRNDKIYTNTIPVEMMKSLALEARVNGSWMPLGTIDNNRTRLIKFNFNSVKTTAIRVKLKETYGAKNAKLFEIRCYA
ncbi:FAD-dependent oxidoreductase [Flavobacterium sp. NG2]|uniref:FAD-dependent oxidoreductase n=1 Tax=Flavobacterium sp. NG2 TaxID=3097547 RepID=UPI002A83EA4A|nr:FAD-dependent oxidoreductase [Flavobacterium sp. NG2]WPR71351.1 FAD-dependent oxidoreductase [Flavobacterium sp. NG2]